MKRPAKVIGIVMTLTAATATAPRLFAQAIKNNQDQGRL